MGRADSLKTSNEQKSTGDRAMGIGENWQKVKAIGIIVKENGEIEEREIHWYEEPTVGRVKLKVKKK